MNRQRLMLVILLCGLAIAVAYSVIRYPRRQEATKRTVTTGAGVSGTKRKATAGDEIRVRLDLLRNVPVRFTGFKKNIFAPIFRDASKLPPVKPVTPAAPPAPAPPPPLITQPTIPPLEQELAQFTFLGLLEKDRNKTIFLARNKEIFLVKKGEKVAGKYEAMAITDDALTLRVLGGDATEIIIPLIENQSLKSSPNQQSGAAPPLRQAERPRRPLP